MEKVLGKEQHPDCNYLQWLPVICSAFKSGSSLIPRLAVLQIV